MNQNNKNKVKDFFRKEGFYFVLILCLCVVAVAANFAIRNNENETSNDEDTVNEFTLNDNSNELDGASDELDDALDELSDASDLEMQNADRAEEDLNVELAEASDELAGTSENSEEEEEVEISMEEETAQVSATVAEVVFQLPLEGEIARAYEEMVKVSADEDGATHMSRGGVDISAAEGSVVRVAADGVVSEVANTPKEGNYVIVTHQNGMKTIYSNLNENIVVAEGDTLTVGAELGTIGNSSQIFTADICGDVLNLQIKDSSGSQINPSEYFNF